MIDCTLILSEIVWFAAKLIIQKEKKCKQFCVEESCLTRNHGGKDFSFLAGITLVSVYNQRNGLVFFD